MGAVETAAGDKFVRDLLRKGRPEQFVADASGWAPSKVQAVADELALDSATAPETIHLPDSPTVTPIPRPAAEAPAPRPPTATGLTIEALTAAAARSTSKRVQAAGKKLATTAEQLRGLLAQEREKEQSAVRAKEEREAKTAKIRELERELAAARAALRGNRAHARTRGADDQAPPQVDSKVVRAWATANGVTCPAVGRLPRPVIDAYLAAQT